MRLIPNPIMPSVLAIFFPIYSITFTIFCFSLHIFAFIVMKKKAAAKKSCGLYGNFIEAIKLENIMYAVSHSISIKQKKGKRRLLFKSKKSNSTKIHICIPFYWVLREAVERYIWNYLLSNVLYMLHIKLIT